MNPSNTRDDRILPETRVVAAGVIFVLALAVLALYIFPQFTDQNFAWTILPPTSAILMGAGYFAGAYFFLRVLTGKQWHHVHAGFLPITAFTICMLLATLLHLSRFHQGSPLFYLWTGIYILTPLLVPFIWWRNRVTDPGTADENDIVFSTRVRWALRIIGLVGALLMLVCFIQPGLLIAVAPWKLTELTARVGAGWGILTALTFLSVGYDGRWSATRILLESASIGMVLMLLALPRVANDLDWSNPVAWLFVASLLGVLAIFIAVHIWLDRQTRPLAATT